MLPISEIDKTMSNSAAAPMAIQRTQMLIESPSRKRHCRPS